MSGCSSLIRPNEIDIPEINNFVLEPCEDLRELKDGSIGQILIVMEDTATKYHDCKNKHSILVEQYNIIVEGL